MSSQATSSTSSTAKISTTSKRLITTTTTKCKSAHRAVLAYHLQDLGCCLGHLDLHGLPRGLHQAGYFNCVPERKSKKQNRTFISWELVFKSIQAICLTRKRCSEESWFQRHHQQLCHCAFPSSASASNQACAGQVNRYKWCQAYIQIKSPGSQR